MKTTTSNVAVDQRWDDIVFEGRNQSYGAYVLRQLYGRHVAIAMVVTLVIFSIFIWGPAIVNALTPEEEIVEAPKKKLVYSELSAPPPLDKPKPPPPQIQLPKLQKVIKFVPPKVVKEQVVEEVPTIEEIKQNEVAAVEVEGPTEVVFEEPVQEVVVDDNQIFTVVEQQPEFTGGYEAMAAFIKKNLKYPASARRMGVEGKVYVQFVVNKDGNITDVKTLRGISDDCDKEAERIVKAMPPWKAGKQNGKPVRVSFVLPIVFKLN